jgi:hypothetical protein
MYLYHDGTKPKRLDESKKICMNQIKNRMDPDCTKTQTSQKFFFMSYPELAGAIDDYGRPDMHQIDVFLRPLPRAKNNQ